jgi:hypothetical protein
VSVDGGESWHRPTSNSRETVYVVRWSYRWDVSRAYVHSCPATDEVGRVHPGAALQQHAQELQRYCGLHGHGRVSNLTMVALMSGGHQAQHRACRRALGAHLAVRSTTLSQNAHPVYVEKMQDHTPIDPPEVATPPGANTHGICVMYRKVEHMPHTGRPELVDNSLPHGAPD